MLRFFRINDPYRLIVVFLILLLIRMPVFLAEDTLTYPELDYLLVGEKFSGGDRLYDEIWTRTGPLSAVFYGVLGFLFDRSQLALQIVAMLIVFLQSFIFNKILLDNKAYDEYTYIPGLIYALLMSWFFDQFSLSPSLLGLTFILLALNNVLDHLQFKAKKDEMIHNIGIHLGVATLFFLPYAIFLPFIIIAFAFFSGTILRRYLLIIYGFFLPLVLAAGIFMVTGRLNEFLLNFIYPSFGNLAGGYFKWTELLLIFAVPLIFFLLSLVSVVQRGRFTVFQANLSQFMMMWVVFGAVYVFLVRTVVPANLLIFVPPVAYYLSHYFLNIRRRWMAEIIFTVFVVSAVLFNLGTFFGFFFTKDFVKTDKYLVEASSYADQTSGKKVLVLGPDMSYYLNAEPSTPFLEWPLAEPVFRELDYYDNLSRIADGIYSDMPDVIIDQQNLMPSLSERIPEFAKFKSADGTLYTR
ncbi:MAG: DUF6427 family protein [Cyclobacteriaceae bacterium]